MQISGIISTFCRPELLGRCLTALSRQRFPHDEFEVIVADDAADDATRRQVEALACGSFRPLYVPVGGRHGPAAARNAGWRATRGAIIAFTDDDCLPAPDWLRPGAAAFVDGVAGVSGAIVMPLTAVPTDYEQDAAGLAGAEFVTANCF